MKETLKRILTNTTGSTDWVVSLSWESILLAMLTAIICGLIIYFVYRFFYRGSFYNDNFNVLLVLVTAITALIITTISSNLALSLGMVGALSIVRFRAAVKDPLDVAFVFFAIAVGITAGAGLYLVAIFGTIVISLIYILMGKLKFNRATYLVIINYKNNAEEKIQTVLKDYQYSLKNKTFHNDQVEMIIEIKSDQDLETKLNKISDVKSVVKVEYNGDYLG